MWIHIAVLSTFMLTILMIALNTDVFGLDQPDDDLYRNTFIFSTFVWLQVFNFINARSVRLHRSPYADLFNNATFLIIVGLIIVIQLLILLYGGDVFNVVPMAMGDWITSVLIGASVLVVGALVRLLGKGSVPEPKAEAEAVV